MRFLDADFEIVTAVADERDLAEGIPASSADVVVSDLSLLPGATRWARRRGREQGRVIGVVALGHHDELASARRLIRPSPAAYVLKWAAVSELAAAIHAALSRPPDLRNR